jgi:REP element-mobilizing transposase RayT
MLHSYTRIFIHLVWAVKNREKLITKDLRPVLRKHILEYSKTRNISIDVLNVQPDHVHILLLLSSEQTLEETVQLLKGESSHWVNHEKLIPQKFAWQRGYGAFSISPSHYDSVKSYITNQDEHHRKKTFMEEYESILKKYGFETSVPALAEVEK